jgi:hypothetical protein
VWWSLRFGVCGVKAYALRSDVVVGELSGI